MILRTEKMYITAAEKAIYGAGFLLVLAANPVAAAMIVVNNKTCTLVDAITAANNNVRVNGCVAGNDRHNGGDIIALQADVTLTRSNNGGDFCGSGTPVITSNVTIEGNGRVIRRSQDSNSDPRSDFRIFDVSGGYLTIRRATVTGGLAHCESGGGIRGDVTLIDSVVSVNYATDNAAGGGIAGNVTMINSTISNNGAWFGGGIYGKVIMIRSVMTGNRAYGNTNAGSAILGDATLINSTISGNSGLSSRGNLSVGAINGSATLYNSTVAYNTATINAYGGPYVGNGGIVGPARLFNSIVANNSGSNLTECADLQFVGVNLIGDGSCDAALNGQLTGDPLLGPLAENGGPTMTHALLPGSPAIDSGDDAICAAPPVNGVDQRGVKRPQGGHCDLGAFEKGPDFSGFQPPVSNLPVLNYVKAGQSVPMKFFAQGSRGSSVFAAFYPVSKQIDCTTDEPIDGAAASSSGQLTAGKNQYNFIWKTEKAWAGTCRQFQMLLSDGTYGQANFLFK